ncbi:hypothetical protein NE236_20255 [Actinoallomurus purpureus]|uniref:hypothetical protein n=1 Tax=Actinoallomurus purpureus TaxID=478114 RepID=UPI002092A639|nr:hypothetical protein [Actinoallomurus purpureus]MCO6007317.1 hypothetical protein [Actinoallomurus purpureus]
MVRPIIQDGFIELAERQLFARRRAGVDWQETGLVFTTKTGRLIEPRNLAHAFERITAKAGLRRIRDPPGEARHRGFQGVTPLGKHKVPAKPIEDRRVAGTSGGLGGSSPRKT